MAYQDLGTFLLIDAAPFSFKTDEWQNADVIIVKLQDAAGEVRYVEALFNRLNTYGFDEPRIGDTVELGRDYSRGILSPLFHSPRGKGRKIYTGRTAQADYVPSPEDTGSLPYASEEDLKAWGRDKVSLEVKRYIDLGDTYNEAIKKGYGETFLSHLATNGRLDESGVLLVRAIAYMLSIKAEKGAYMLALMHVKDQATQGCNADDKA